MRVSGDIVFFLARLDAAQAADAFRGIDTERPTVLAPVISRNNGIGRCLRSRRGLWGDGACRRCGGAIGQGASKTTQKVAPFYFVLLELLFLFHCRAPGKKR